MIYDLLNIFAQYLIKWKAPEPSESQNNSVQPGYLLGAAAPGRDNRRQYDFEGGVDEESGLPLPQINNSSESPSWFTETCRVILLAKIQALTTL